MINPDIIQWSTPSREIEGRLFWSCLETRNELHQKAKVRVEEISESIHLIFRSCRLADSETYNGKIIVQLIDAKECILIIELSMNRDLHINLNDKNGYEFHEIISR